MKLSKYNFFFPFPEDESKHIAFNGFKTSLALIDNDKYNQVLAFEKNSEYILDDELQGQLTLGGFLIEDIVDEIALLRHEMNVSRYSSDTLQLTIAPTLDCNFRCAYCYEKDNLTSQRMSEVTQQAILSLIKSRVSSVNSLSVLWYGGEPLLALDIIEKLSKQILTIIGEKNIDYHAGIVTNGYLLSERTAKRLTECKIRSCQITVDGLAETHNKRRPLKNGQPTYEQIMENISSVKGVLPNIALRVNMDKDNVTAIYEINDYLKERGLDDYVKAYPAAISNTNNCYQPDLCLQGSDFARLEFEYIKHEYNLNKDKCYLPNSAYPIRKRNFCGADSSSSFVISADGSLYKCWSDIGVISRSFGNICESNTSLMKEILYSSIDPTQNEQCRNCAFLPMCMGGCPFQYLQNNKDRCDKYAYQMEQYLFLLCQGILQKRKEANSFS